MLNAEDGTVQEITSSIASGDAELSRISDPQLAADDDPFEAHIGASIRHGCANNRYLLILRTANATLEIPTGMTIICDICAG